MKVCDKCGSTHAKTYKQTLPSIQLVDLCTKCLQEVVLTTQSKLEEINIRVDYGNGNSKTVIHG